MILKANNFNLPIVALREKCPNTELFLVGIFLYLDWIRRDTEYLSVFSPNTGKYQPEIILYLDTSPKVVFAKDTQKEIMLIIDPWL